MLKGTTLIFSKKIANGVDALNNPITQDIDIEVDDCLVAPISEPVSVREQQAMDQSRDQVRIHIPKTFSGDISDSEVVWDGKTFKVDSDSVAFMIENTPTRWNRYFRGEAIV